MGKYATTRAFQRDREKTSDSRSDTFSSVADYLTEVPQDESQFKVQAFLYNWDPTGIFRGYLGSRDASNYWSDYFRNTGLNWSDVKYPTMMMNYGSLGYGGVARATWNFIGKNISRLYK